MGVIFSAFVVGYMLFQVPVAGREGGTRYCGGTGVGKGRCGPASEGANVVVAARRLDRLNETAQQIQGLGGTSLAVQTDVTDEGQVIRLFKRTIEVFDRLDILVNNAGLVEGGALDQLPVETWDRVIATNLRGPFLCTREAMQIMKT